MNLILINAQILAEEMLKGTNALAYYQLTFPVM